MVPDSKGVALCSRKVFLGKVDYWVSNTKLAVVLPGGKEWFQTKDLTKAAVDRLNAAKTVQFTYQYRDAGGNETRTPKQGLLVQLGAVRVKQIVPEVHKVEIQEYVELTLNIYKEAVPPEVWKIAAANKDKFFHDSLGRLLGEPPPIFKRTAPYFRGEECIQTTIKILPGYVEKVLTNSDKHHLFSRLTLRNGLTDDGYEKLWLPRTKDLSLAQETRLYREKAMRLVGEDFKGIAFRGRGDDGRGRAQVGLRVNLGVVDRVRHHFLREDQLPIPEARGVKQKLLWTLRGVPANFEARTLAKALLQHMKWTVVALKELSRPSAPVATWLVSSDVEPPSPKWWINTGTGRPTLVTINPKMDGGKSGGRKGGEEVVLREGMGKAGGRTRAGGGDIGKGMPSKSSHLPHRPAAYMKPQSEDGGSKRRRHMDEDGGDGDVSEKFAEIYSIGEDDPINVDDIYVNKDDEYGGGMRRPSFLPQADDGEDTPQDDYEPAGGPSNRGQAACSEEGTEDTEEAESASRVSLLSSQRGRQSAWGPARKMRQSRGPYGGGEVLIMPGAETPTAARGSKETWADATENAAEGGQQSWQEDHRKTLNRWKTHQPEKAGGIATPVTTDDYMASISAMMKDMARDQTDLRQRVEAEKEARTNAEALQHNQHQGVLATLHELATLVKDMKQTMMEKERRTSRSRDKSTSRTFRRSDSTRGRIRGGTEESGEPITRRQRTQLEDGDDRNMSAASAPSLSE